MVVVAVVHTGRSGDRQRAVLVLCYLVFGFWNFYLDENCFGVCFCWFVLVFSIGLESAKNQNLPVPLLSWPPSRETYSPLAWFISKITLGGKNTQSCHPSSASVGQMFVYRVDTSESVLRLFPRALRDTSDKASTKELVDQYWFLSEGRGVRSFCFPVPVGHQKIYIGTRRLILIPVRTSGSQVFLLFWASWHTEKDARHSETIACLLSRPDRKRLMFVRVWLD